MALAHEADFGRSPPISWTSRCLFWRSGSCLRFANRDSSAETDRPTNRFHPNRPGRRSTCPYAPATSAGCHLRRHDGAPWPPVHTRSRPSSRLVVSHRHAVVCPDIHRGPLFRCLVSRVTRARNHIGRHPMIWPPPISGRDGKPRSDHNGVGNAGCMTPMRSGQLSMIQSNAILLHIEH